jgi:hypothetical protein
MASNVVIDGTTIASLQSDLASVKQYLTQTQYYYQARNNASASVFPYLHSGTTQSMSVYQTTVSVTITAAKQSLQLVVPPNSFKDTPIVSALVECAAAPGPMSVVLTNIATDGSYGMTFDIYTTSTSTTALNVPAFIHITAISYE